MKNKVYIIGNFSFPRGNASGSRVLANGYLLRTLGYDVKFIGIDNRLKADSKIVDTKQDYDGFTYYNLPYPIGIKGWLDYNKRFKEVISIIKQEQTYAIITYGSPTVSLFNKLMLSWCRRNMVINITDVVDWLGANSGSFFHRLVKFLDTNYQKRYLNAKADGVITISTFLENYYKNKNCKTVVIPPLVNSERYNHLKKIIELKNNDGAINFIYVGTPFAIDGRIIKKDSYKDRLDIVLETLYNMKDRNFIFNIYGLNLKQYLLVVKKHNSLLKSLENKVIFHGVIENEEVIDKIAMADFSLLFRDVNKMTSSGFPTKFVETLSCGTPIITNKTSDIADYLKEGINGFLVDVTDKNKLIQDLDRILQMSKNDILLMKNKTFASKIFDYSNFSVDFKSFLQNIIVL